MDWSLVLAADAAAIVLAIGVGVGYLTRMGGRITRLEHKVSTQREDILELRAELRTHTTGSGEVLQRLAVVETEMKAIRVMLERLLDRDSGG